MQKDPQIFSNIEIECQKIIASCSEKLLTPKNKLININLFVRVSPWIYVCIFPWGEGIEHSCLKMSRTHWLKVLFWESSPLHYTTAASLLPNIGNIAMTGRKRSYPIPQFLPELFLFPQNLIFKKQKWQKFHSVPFFLREHPAISKSPYLFTAATILFVNFISVILRLPPPAVASHPYTVLPALALPSLECSYSQLS